MTTIGLAATLAVALAAGVSAAWAATPSSESVRARMENVERLIERSSGARQVEQSGRQAATERRQSARSLYRQAERAHGERQYADADALLERATKEMFEAVRLAGAPPALVEKKRDDFAAREQSIGVLVEALERIGGEKGQRSKTHSVAASVKEMTAEANALRASGRVDEGREALDRAYEVAKKAIEELRGGETLVRSLNFESKEEEFHYELDRNDTHRMLVDVLASEKRANASIDKMVTAFMERAAKLRAEAEQRAARGEYAGAVETLEMSTMELIRAIRSTGIYIPG